MIRIPVNTTESTPTDQPAAMPDMALVSSPPLQGERVAFTGTLASMTHRQAHQVVEGHGGQAMGHVSRQTTLVVVGEEGWPLEPDGNASIKLHQAVELINQGQPLRILKESEWLRLLGLEQREREVHRLHTPAMLHRLLGVPVNLVRRWERLGLIRAVQRVYRLPYFDFQEVAGVRKLHELLEAGVPRMQIEASLTALRTLLPSVDRPIAQLDILERDARVLVRDAKGLVDPHNGQRLLDFESPGAPQPNPAVEAPDETDGPSTIRLERTAAARERQRLARSADEWFEHGSRLLESDDPQAAVEALRMALMEKPDQPEFHMLLADALFRCNNLHGALERLHVAVELDNDYIEAWTQLGCIRHLLGDHAGAIDAFDIALDAHPEFADALFHKASVLSELGRQAEATGLWEKYLNQETRGPWADTARQNLLKTLSD